MSQLDYLIDCLKQLGYKPCTLGVASVMAHMEYMVDDADDGSCDVILGPGSKGYASSTVTFKFDPDGKLIEHVIHK